MGKQDFSYAKKGLFVRLAYLCIALASELLRRISGRPIGIIVLCYHSVLASQRDDFEQQMRYVAERAIALDQVDEQRDDGRVVVTFDDAFACLQDNVIPVVRRYRISIAVFAVSENLGKRPGWLAGTNHADADLITMTADELKYLSCEPGCLIGSHSACHRPLGALPTADIEFELSTSRAKLEEILGTSCRYLALPHGSYRAEVIELALHNGYKKVLTLDEIALPSRWPQGTVGRFSASPDMWMIEFALTVRGAYAWLYSWRNFLRRLRRVVVEKQYVAS